MDPLEQNNLESPPGRSLGNGWVICKSKSRNNIIYYFNTLTRESVWNLSEANKETAVNQISEECPEPTEPTTKNKKYFTTQMNNLPVSNYQSVKPPPILLSTLGGPQLSTLIETGPAHLGGNIVWDRPPPNYPYSALAAPPVPLQVSSTDKHDITVQNTTIPLSQRFQNIKEQCRKPVFMSKEKVKTSYGKLGAPTHSRLKHNIGLDDLRLKLFAKSKIENVPRTSVLCNEDSNDNRIERAMYQLNVTGGVKKAPVIYGNFTITKPESDVTVDPRCIEIYKDIICDEDDELWIAQNTDNNEDNKSVIDTTPLVSMAPYGTPAEHWYIMADTNVYIKNLIFLKILINSDDHCHLLVSETVLKELRYIAAGQSNTNKLEGFASQAIALLNQLIASGKALKDKDVLRNINPGTVVCPISDDQIINCCLKIAENNFHVILLSNDKLLERKTSTTSLPIFTVDKVKNLLASFRKEKKLSKEIFITINNNEHHSIVDEAQNNSHTEIDPEIENIKQAEEEFIENYAYNNPRAQQLTENDVQSRVNENESFGRIETYLPTSPESSRVESPVENVPDSKPTAAANVATNGSESRTSGNTTIKSRVIRLKRKTELRSSPLNENTKKTTKWRRRPLTKASPINKEELDNQDKPTSATKEATKQSVERPKYLIEIRPHQAEALEKFTSSPQENDEVASSVGNASCSSVVNRKEPIKIIEETSNSSSDVITNSRSSINSDKPKLSVSKYTRRGRTLDNNSSFADTMDKAMVDNLNKCCEEWVSIFVQIMEDVLTLVLLYNEMPIEEGKFLPLNIYEATDLVKKRFSHHVDVLRAASRLADILLKVKDSRGSVRRSLNPQDYMEMFLCGERLTRSLQKVLPQCEDIKTSEQLLGELLNDIKVPKSFGESFESVESCHAGVASADVTSENIYPPANDMNSQVNLSFEPHSPEDYKAPIKTTFVKIAPEGLKLIFSQNKKKHPSMFMFGHEKKTSYAIKPITSNVEANKIGPKISFKFNIDPKFEERLKARKQLEIAEAEEVIDEEMEEKESASCDLNEDDGTNDSNKYDSPIHDFNGQLKIEEPKASVLKIFRKEIKDMFLYVNGLCKDTCSELSIGNLSITRLKEIETQAQDAYSTMENILGRLNNILERESNIKPLVQNSFEGRPSTYNRIFRIPICTVDSTSREVILKCTVQAKVLLDALNPIRNLNSNLT